jgi:putative solute:sodium symporter small subunit
LLFHLNIEPVQEEEYRISLFKPTTQQALKNRNLILQLFVVWAIAIFGFQILLKILEKPVPEDALVAFSAAWEKVESGNADAADYISAGQSMVQAMGKSTIKDHEYIALQDGVGWMLANVYPAEDLDGLQRDIHRLSALREQITSLGDEDYLEAKALIVSKTAPALDIGEGTLLAQLLAVGLDGELMQISDENKSRIPGIMGLYMTHNRSVLTDTIFLGFPFHYFYTAVFLLVFFIGLCWFYCYKTDKLHARLNFLELESND